MLDGITPVAMSATDSPCEETNAFNGPLQVETVRKAEARWPVVPRWLLERALFKHTVSARMLRVSARHNAVLRCPHFPQRRRGLFLRESHYL